MFSERYISSFESEELALQLSDSVTGGQCHFLGFLQFSLLFGSC